MQVKINLSTQTLLPMWHSQGLGTKHLEHKFDLNKFKQRFPAFSRFPGTSFVQEDGTQTGLCVELLTSDLMFGVPSLFRDHMEGWDPNYVEIIWHTW